MTVNKLIAAYGWSPDEWKRKIRRYRDPFDVRTLSALNPPGDYQEAFALAFGVPVRDIWPDSLHGGAEPRWGLSLFNFDPRRHGIYQVMKWTEKHVLYEDNVAHADEVMAAPQDWFLLADLNSRSTKAITADVRNTEPDFNSRTSPSLRSWQVDDRETEASWRLRMKVSAADKADIARTEEDLQSHPEIGDELSARAVNLGLSSVIRSSPSTRLRVLVTVTSADWRIPKFTAPERQAGVAHWFPGLVADVEWVNSAAGRRAETCFETARRALSGLGLTADGFDAGLTISWLGCDLRRGANWFVAHVNSTLTFSELSRAASRAGAWSMGDTFVPLTHSAIDKQVVGPWRRGSGVQASVCDPMGAVAIAERWRLRKYMDSYQ